MQPVNGGKNICDFTFQFRILFLLKSGELDLNLEGGGGDAGLVRCVVKDVKQREADPKLRRGGGCRRCVGQRRAGGA